MLYTVQTTKSPEQAGAALEAAVKRHQFGVLVVHDLQASMAKHGLTFPKPCRIAVYIEGDQTTLAMICPTTLLGLFNEPGLQSTACEVERELVAIMDEAV